VGGESGQPRGTPAGVAARDSDRPRHPAERVGFRFDYAYQPIVDLHTRSVFAHEAPVRGPEGQGAMSMLSQVNDHNRYRFDQACRVKAIKSAAQLGLQERLSTAAARARPSSRGCSTPAGTWASRSSSRA
jgi:EAL domain-containing protein (putative c-di-GMP-specific phosphodiesterase class I)